MSTMQRAVSPPAEQWSDVGRHASPLGTLWSCWSERGLFRLAWEEPPAETVGRAPSDRAAAAFDRQLASFFSGAPDALRSVPVDLRGWTAFFIDVYQACRRIPGGETCRYADLAEAAGRPRAVRAVGQAMARNRIPLVIPCHRVVGSDGRLRGFSAPGGLNAKQRLLDLEREHARSQP